MVHKNGRLPTEVQNKTIHTNPLHLQQDVDSLLLNLLDGIAQSMKNFIAKLAAFAKLWIFQGESRCDS